MMLALTGLVRYQSPAAPPTPRPTTIPQLGRGVVEDVPIVEVIPYPLIVLTVLCVAAAWLMRRPFGRTLLAVGDNPASSPRRRLPRVVGQDPGLHALLGRRHRLRGPAGRLRRCPPRVGQGYEFAAITAVVLGGVVLGGGRGWVLSAAAGAFALELLFTLLTVLEVESTWRDTVQGLIIIVAVALAGRAWHGSAGAPRPRGRPIDVHDHHTHPPTPGTNTGEDR